MGRRPNREESTQYSAGWNDGTAAEPGGEYTV